eukprot:1586758-Rhodomonas_salina.1
MQLHVHRRKARALRPPPRINSNFHTFHPTKCTGQVIHFTVPPKSTHLNPNAKTGSTNSSQSNEPVQTRHSHCAYSRTLNPQ